MKISGNFVVLGKNPSKKNDNVYVKLFDISTQGEVNMSFPPQSGAAELVPGSTVDLNVSVKPGLFGSNQFLSVVENLKKGG